MERPAKATLRETRAHNEGLVLSTIYDDGPVSRADVARLTGLTRTTVSVVVEGLLAGGLVREIGRGPSTGGKAPILLEVGEGARLLAGLDLGETAFRGAILNLRGEAVCAVQVPVGESDGERALERVYELVDRLLAAAERPVVGLGIGAPGLIDTTVGTVLRAVKIDWRDVPLGTLLRERYGLPVYVANDSQVAALAEHAFGPVRAANLVAVKVGHGIGAGLILDGRLFQGDGFGAGEIGHTVVAPDGELCRCGSRGCLETVASTRAVLSRIGAASASGEPVSLEGAVAAFQRGDPLVRDAVLQAGTQLGLAVAALVGALNVRRIVLSGTMASFGETWLQAVDRAMRRSALSVLVDSTTVELGGIDDIVVLGAAALLMRRELGLVLRRAPTARSSGVAA